MAHRRIAASLVELLVVIGILAATAAVILPAVQQVRAAALRTQSMHQMRQLALANHSYAAVTKDYMPRHIVHGATNFASAHGSASMFTAILPYIEGGPAILASTDGYPPVPLFISPADPSASSPNARFELARTFSSYAPNAWAYSGLPRLPQSYPDGTSSTILLAEHYGKCNDTLFEWFVGDMYLGPDNRRPSFADGGSFPNQPMWNDVHPVTTGFPPVTRSSVPGVTFQVRPHVMGECDPRQPQTPHPNGMIVAMVDGSTRVVRQGVRNEVFWAAVTPAGGEVASLD